MTNPTDPATKADLDRAIQDLKLYLVDRETGWLKWVVGFQLIYFAVTIAAMFFIVEHVK